MQSADYLEPWQSHPTLGLTSTDKNQYEPEIKGRYPGPFGSADPTNS